MENQNINEEEKQFQRMTEKRIEPLILAQSIPTVVSMLVTSIYNTADTFFVSNLGVAQSGAVSVAFSLMSLIQAVGFGLGMGSGSLISRHLGKKEEKKAHEYATCAFAASLLFGALLLVFGGIWIRPLMFVLGARDDILTHTIAYGKYIILGAPIMCASFVMNNILRAQGKSKLSMIGLSIGGILNIGLDPLFIFVFKMGIEGAALATLCSQVISFGILLLLMLSKKSIVRIHPKFLKFRFSYYSKIIVTGLPTIFRQGLASLATAVLNNVTGTLTDSKELNEACVAAIGIANKVYLLVRNLVIGIGQGFQPIAGYNYGAGKNNRVRDAFWFTVKLGTAICIVFSAAMAIFAEPIMNFFVDDQNPEKIAQVVQIGKAAILYLSAELPFLAYSTYANQMLQCLGKSGGATFLASCRQGIFFLPLIFTLPHFFGILGIQLTQPIADMLTMLVTIPIQIRFFKSLLTEKSS